MNWTQNHATMLEEHVLRVN